MSRQPTWLPPKSSPVCRFQPELRSVLVSGITSPQVDMAVGVDKFVSCAIFLCSL